MAAKLPTIQTLLAAGINPKTGLPLKMDSIVDGPKDSLKRFLRIIDETDAVNRYKWYNIPSNITGQELERMLYYKGQLAFFYIEELDQFYFMPYALNGTIDFYGRYNTIHPVPFAGGSTDDKNVKKQADYLSQLSLDCVYDVIEDEEVDYKTMIKSTVLIHDYTKQLSQTIIPRQTINDPLVDMEAETLSFMRTALVSGTGILGVRVNDADQADSVIQGSKGVIDAALTGIPYVPMIGTLDFQELTNGQITKAEDYLLSVQAIDNLRLSGYGIDNGGLFQKKAHMLESESQMASPSVGMVYQDGLSIRQHFCNIVNSIWGLGIWCEAAESVIGADTDGDGVAYDRQADVEQGTTGGKEDDNE